MLETYLSIRKYILQILDENHFPNNIFCYLQMPIL